MINVYGPFNTGASAGGAGVSTANATSTVPLGGILVALYVKYNDSPPSTTDVTIATLGTSPSAPALTLLTLTNANTDGWFYPRALIHNTSGTASTTVYDYLPLLDKVKVTIAQANDADSVDVWFLVDDNK